MKILLFIFAGLVYSRFLVYGNREGNIWQNGTGDGYGQMMIVNYRKTTGILIGHANETYKYPPEGMKSFYNISVMTIVDTSGTLEELQYVNGGPGHDHVTLLLKTYYNVRMDILIHIWGYHKTDACIKQEEEQVDNDSQAM